MKKKNSPPPQKKNQLASQLDVAEEDDCVDLSGHRNIKNKNNIQYVDDKIQVTKIQQRAIQR